MNSKFTWAALIAIGLAIFVGIIHYGFHFYKWFMSETPNETVDIVMSVVVSLFVVVGFFLLIASIYMNRWRAIW